jgi:cyanophycinase
MMRTKRGFVIPIGGAEKKLRHATILRRFVELCGGAAARIAIVPTASKLDDTGEIHRRAFAAMGVGQIDILHIRDRADAMSAEVVAALGAASGIFMTGGDQLRLSTILGGTEAAEAIRRANARGVHVAGTSAGAAFISEHMICYGRGGPTPRMGMTTLAPGLGLTRLAIVDQHFRERDRIGRLMTALAFNPALIGLGVDEDTAAFIDGDDVLEVVGSGGVTVLDPSGVTQSSMAAARKGGAVGIFGLRLNVLVSGDRFDLHRRVPVLG